MRILSRISERMRKSIAKDILPDDASGGGKSMEIVFPLFTKQTSVCAD